jgi:hypothetical protein
MIHKHSYRYSDYPNVKHCDSEGFCDLDAEAIEFAASYKNKTYTIILSLPLAPNQSSL